MNDSLLLMNNNDVFNHILHLTGLHRDSEQLIKLLAGKGCNATKSQIRSWRRKQGLPNSREVPDFVMISLFRVLFDEKNKNQAFFSLNNEENKVNLIV
ncbi:hypothetical protein [Aggregatibacter kilianii]|uniref:hypothetical protein n=1 Tax=Aggregatibacter kilianii TaxID=2025884 RepID=UPI000D691DAC|nr:hypothetical protein [Aggregatibacter kilianii]